MGHGTNEDGRITMRAEVSAPCRSPDRVDHAGRACGYGFLCTISFLALAPNLVSAGANANGKLLLHIVRGDFITCERPSSRPLCAGVGTAAALYPTTYLVGLLAMDADPVTGVAAVEFGLQYAPATGAGVDVFSWQLCGDTEATVDGPHGPWPTAGSGNVILWNETTHCQRFVPAGGTATVAVAGYIYCAAYTPDLLEVTPSPYSGLALIADCGAVIDTVEGGFVQRNPSHLGAVRFSSGGTEPGYNPCGLVTPVTATTWGTLKSHFAPTR